jgi:ethanolamine phosphate phosphodiesterase
LILTDPQLTDIDSYDFLRHKTLLRAIVERLSDGYMRKSFSLLVARLQPADVFILGDLFDSARTLTAEQHAVEQVRFWSVFPFPRERLHLMAGNHDVGYALEGPRKAELVKRFESAFGPINWERLVGPLRWTAVATTEIAPPADRGKWADATWRFVEGLDRKAPRVLLTHVPLFRPVHEDCGPLRLSRRPLPHAIGNGYVTVVAPEVTERLLGITRPIAVFSGDDHDPCEVQHRLPHLPGSTRPSVPELTVGTFSYLQGVLWPSLAVATQSSWCGEGNASVACIDLAVRLCWLPSQPLILVSYGLAGAVSIALVLLLTLRRTARELAGAHARARDLPAGAQPDVSIRSLVAQVLYQLAAGAGVAVGTFVLIHYLRT